MTTDSFTSESTMPFKPHVTVATVVEREGKFLFVEESCHGQVVLNQPAGHLEENESLIQAASRETFEETGWEIEITGFLGIALYRSPANGTTYHRTTFVGRPINHVASAKLDTGILRALWLTPEEAKQQVNLRSPLVIQAVEQFLSQKHLPLSLIGNCLD